MSDILIPPDLQPVSPEQFELVDDATMVFAPSLSRGNSQRISFGDPRWRITRKYLVRQSDRARLAGLVQSARGRFITVRTCPGNPPRGSFAGAELLVNNTFFNGTVGWTAQSSSVAPTMNVIDQIARITRNSIDANSGIYQSVTSVQSAAYMARGFFQRANDSSYNYAAWMGGLYSPVVTDGVAKVTVVATGTTLNSAFLCPSQGTSGRFFEVPYADVQRVALVASGNWSGGGMNLSCLPASQNSLAMAGDFLEINGELKQLTSVLASDASGIGYAMFRPALFRAPSSGDPVIFGAPMGRFLLSEVKWDNQYGVYSDLSLTLDEVYEP